MSISTTLNVTIGPGVPEFLRNNGAEADFKTLCELIREGFPEMKALEARLEEDYEVPGLWRVVFTVTHPASYPMDRFLDEDRRYHERRAERVPLPDDMLFVMLHDSAPE